MGQVFTTNGLVIVAGAVGGAWNGGTVAPLLRLYVNDFVPVKGMTPADFIEASFPGYAAIPSTSWGTASADAAGDGMIQDAQRTFSSTGPSSGQSVYGYYVTDGPGGAVLWAERSPTAPFDMNGAGRSYVVRPKQTFRNYST